MENWDFSGSNTVFELQLNLQSIFTLGKMKVGKGNKVVSETNTEMQR